MLKDHGVAAEQPRRHLKLSTNNPCRGSLFFARLSYNAGLNGTAMGSGVIDVSDGRVLVTEMMIMAGEAMGKWCAERDIKVAYRNQPKPRFIERQVEYNFYKEMRKNDVGNGWPASWYVRRFMEPVEVGEERKGHAGLGLDEYVQWSSPIRR